MIFQNGKPISFVIKDGKKYQLDDGRGADYTVLGVNAAETRTFTIHSLETTFDDQSITIDWGDGTKESFLSENDYKYFVQIPTILKRSGHSRPRYNYFEVVEYGDDFKNYVAGNREFNITLQGDLPDNPGRRRWQINETGVVFDTLSVEAITSVRGYATAVKRCLIDTSHTYEDAGEYTVKISNNCRSINITNNVLSVGEMLSSIEKLASKINHLDDFCFARAVSLKNAYVPSTISAMDKGVFQECSSITDITFEDIMALKPRSNGYLSGVSFFGHTFAGCTSLSSIHSPGNYIEFTDYLGETKQYLQIPGSIGEYELCVIGEDYPMPNPEASEGEFSGCENLETICRFNDLSILYSRSGNGSTDRSVFYNNQKVTHILLPNARYFGRSAVDTFMGCSNLKYIYLPKMEKFNASYIFHYLDATKDLYLDMREKDIDSDIPTVNSNTFNVSGSKDKTGALFIIPTEMFGRWCNADNWVKYAPPTTTTGTGDNIPSAIISARPCFYDYIKYVKHLDAHKNGDVWTANGEYLSDYVEFENLSDYTGDSFTISVTGWGQIRPNPEPTDKYVFLKFENGETEAVDGFNSTQRSGIKTASKGRNITFVEIGPGVVSMDGNTFRGSSVSCIQFSDNPGMKTINYYDFAYTPNLKSIDLPSSLTRLGDYVFLSSGLETIRIGQEHSQLTDFGVGVFSDCQKLSSVYFDKNITKLTDFMFQNVSYLSVLSLTAQTQVPSMVKESVSNGTFCGAHTYSLSIFVPASLYSSWIANANWVDLTSNIIAV